MDFGDPLASLPPDPANQLKDQTVLLCLVRLYVATVANVANTVDTCFSHIKNWF